MTKRSKCGSEKTEGVPRLTGKLLDVPLQRVACISQGNCMMVPTAGGTSRMAPFAPRGRLHSSVQASLVHLL